MRPFAVVAIVVPVIAGLLSVQLGKDMNWDFQNYHYYNAFAFLEGRLNYDIAPAQLQTFLNPVLDVPFYMLSRSASAPATGFVMGWLHGFNLVLLFLVFLQITRIRSTRTKIAGGVALIIVSGISPGFLAELGSTMNDNLISLFILGALPLFVIAGPLLANGDEVAGLRFIALAGLIVGAGVGLKQTVVIYALSLPLALLAYPMGLRRRMASWAVFGASGFLGVLLTAGWWWWNLWTAFGNPFLPFMNTVFHSPFVDLRVMPGLLEGHRRVSSSALEWLAWPFIMAVDSRRVSQIGFRDLRFALLYAVSLAWLVGALRRPVGAHLKQPSPATGDIFDRNPRNFLLLFFLLGFVLWLAKFSTYRYLITLELLVPLCFLLVLDGSKFSARWRMGLLSAAIIVTAVYFKPYDWGRTGWGERYISVDTAPYAEAGRSRDPLVVMLGWYPTAYVIPHLPPSFRFIRPESNLQLEPQNLFYARIVELIRAHEGALFVLYDSAEKSVDVASSLAQLDVAIVGLQCRRLSTQPPDTLTLCEVYR